MKLEFSFKQATSQKELRAEGAIDFSNIPIQALMGPSGVGKSSFAKWLAGINPKGQGALRWQGVSMDGFSPQARRIGYLAQGNSLFPHLSVRENIGYGLRRASPRDQTRRVDALLRMVGATKFEMSYPNGISGGEKRRVALAQGLAVRPSLLLLDEPFTGLDAAAKKILWADTKAWLESERVPTLLITHDEEEAAYFGGQVHRYEDGVLSLGVPSNPL